MTKPKIFKGKFSGIWHFVDEEGYCGSGYSIKSAYEAWVKRKKEFKMVYHNEIWEPHIIPLVDTKPWEPEPIPYPTKSSLWLYQGNPEEDYSDLVWYKRWWKRFADIWKGD